MDGGWHECDKSPDDVNAYLKQDSIDPHRHGDTDVLARTLTAPKAIMADVI